MKSSSPETRNTCPMGAQKCHASGAHTAPSRDLGAPLNLNGQRDQSWLPVRAQALLFGLHGVEFQKHRCELLDPYPMIFEHSGVTLEKSASPNPTNQLLPIVRLAARFELLQSQFFLCCHLTLPKVLLRLSAPRHCSLTKM